MTFPLYRGIRDERSPEARARDEAERAERAHLAAEKRARNAEALRLAVSASWPAPPAWQPIETCPFEAIVDGWGIDGAILVSDGVQRAIALVRERFGTPLKIVQPFEPVLTDHGVTFVGKAERFERPDWWFAWELLDALETPSELYGLPEICFVPTLWLCLAPMPPSMTGAA